MLELADARTCGGCTACCVAMGIETLRKQQGVACRYCTGTGCAIYNDKPKECSDFKCLWLDDSLERLTRGEDRPDQSGVIFSGLSSDVAKFKTRFREVALQAFEAWPGAFKTYRAQKLLARVAKRSIVVLFAFGDKVSRPVIGPERSRHNFAELQREAERQAKSRFGIESTWTEGDEYVRPESRNDQEQLVVSRTGTQAGPEILAPRSGEPD